jgi:serine/threonine-protein kinase
VNQAAADRDDIVRLVEQLPRGERDQIPEIVPTARALHDKLQSLAFALDELERADRPGAIDAVEREITTLEAQANPLEGAASEERVRRLAQLKRQRRALSETTRKRQLAAERLENCRLALQNLRYDVLRFRTGAQTHQNITLLAERAMSLARDVDGIVAADDELARARPRA